MIRQLTTAAIVTVAAIAANLGSTSEAMAQPATETRTVQQHQLYVQQHKLGIQMIARSNGLEVINATPGSPAARLGLEAGDLVLQINGRRVTCVHTLEDALSNAAQYQNGQIRVLIDNVRARFGEPGAQRYINAQTFLNGFQMSSGMNNGIIHGSSGMQSGVQHGHGHITGG